MRNFKWYLTYNGTTEQAFPADWQKVGLSYKRHRTYHGVLRSYTLPVRFPKRSGYGGDFIIEAYDSEGLGAVIEIEGYIFNGQTDDYDLFYKGIIDMKPDAITFTKDYVEVSIIDGSKENKFITRDEIEYDLFKRVSTDGVTTPAFSGHPKDVTFKSIDIYLDNEFDVEFNPDLFQLFQDDQRVDEEFISFNKTDVNDIDLNESEDSLNTASGEIVIYENKSEFTEFFNISFLSGVLNIGYSLARASEGDNTGPLHGQLDWTVKRNGFSIYSTTIEDNLEDGEAVKPNTYSENFGSTGVTTGTLDPGDTITLFVEVDSSNSEGGGGNGDYNFQSIDHEFQLSARLIIISDGQDETTAKSFMLHEAFTRLIALQTSETDTSKIFESKAMGRTDSEFKSYGSRLTVLSNIALSNGFLIRKFPSPALNVSFKELFQSADSLQPIGLGFDRDNDVFYIERRQDFYKGEFMFDLGDVDELEVMPLPDFYYNRIHAGYDGKVEYEEINGAKEFNTATEHSIPITVKDDLQVQSKYRIDSIGMELARRKQYSKFASTDTRYDEDNFLVYLDIPGFVTEQGYGSPSGFLGVENYYNIRISPRENLLRHAQFINSTLWKSDKKIQFVKSQKNIDFQYDTFRGDTVNQLDDITESETSFYSELYRPEIHKLKSYITKERIEKLNSNPHGYIQYTFNGNQYQGFLWSLETEEYNKLATFEIIPRGSFTNQFLLAEDGETLTDESGSGLITE